MTQWFKVIIHNCVIHPLLPFLPRCIAGRLHNWNANWTFKNHP